MLDELEIHMKLDENHENVVNLMGVCSSSGGMIKFLKCMCNKICVTFKICKDHLK